MSEGDPCAEDIEQDAAARLGKLLSQARERLNGDIHPARRWPTAERAGGIMQNPSRTAAATVTIMPRWRPSPRC